MLKKSWDNSNVFVMPILLIVYALLIVVFANDPFFGDAISTVSRCAQGILESNFNELRYPEGMDPGHPITFPLLYALVWKLFGAGLLQSHLINLIFSFGITWRVVQWLRQEKITKAWIGACVLLITPQFVAQSVQMNTHLPLTFFTISLTLSLRKKQLIWSVVWSVALILTHLQGLYYLVPIWIWYWFWQDGSMVSKVKRMWPIVIIPGVVFGLWLLYHHAQAGWYLSSPDYASHRGSPSVKGIFKNLILADWRIADYGQIALFIIPVIILWRRRFSYPFRSALAAFLIIYAFNAVALAVTTQLGPAHRYVFPAIPFLVITTAKHFSEVKYGTRLTVIVILASGFLWHYPGKTLGDATLTYRSAFPLIEQLNKEYPEDTIYTYAPLGNYSQNVYLEEGRSNLAPLYNQGLNSCRYILVSNIGGDFSSSEKNELRTNWTTRTYINGKVYFELYQNPEFGRFEPNEPRVKSEEELFMESLKKRFGTSD